MKRSLPDRIASAYRFPERIGVHSQGRTPAGFYVGCEPYVTLPHSASLEDIGRAVQAVLNGFRSEVPQPADFKEITRAFVRGMGAKSHKQLQSSAIYCGILEREGRLEFEPSHNGGTSGDSKGFQYIRGAGFSIAADALPEEIGAALLRGFDLCTTIYL